MDRGQGVWDWAAAQRGPCDFAPRHVVRSGGGVGVVSAWSGQTHAEDMQEMFLDGCIYIFCVNSLDRYSVGIMHTIGQTTMCIYPWAAADHLKCC